MNTEYTTEEGYYFSDEDGRCWAKWKIQELREKNFTNEEILKFDDSESWRNSINELFENEDN